jgi:hypothetical protein
MEPVNVKFKMFALLTFQQAMEEAKEAISYQKGMLEMYKKAWHRIYNLDADKVEKFFEPEHPIHEAYKRFRADEPAA